MSQDVNSPMFFDGIMVPDGEFGLPFFYYYLYVLFNLTTPLVLLGLVFGAVSSMWRREKDEADLKLNSVAAGLAIALVVFLVIMTFSSKKADRYVVSAFLIMDLLAGAGFWLLITQLRRVLPKARAYLGAAIVVVVVGLQAFLVWEIAPYYHSYYNPLWGSADRYAERFQVGWGEGLDQAARYLNGKDNISQNVVYSWYSATFDLFYNKRSKEIFISLELLDDQFEEILAGDYAVVYISQWQRQPDALLIKFLADKQPEYTVVINGFEYVKVYNLKEIADQAAD
jgi:hypothetical protein